MSVFEKLNQAATECGLKYMVIGGHAVIDHGFQRATEDVDILACKDNREAWTRLAESIGYHVFNDGGSFVQFEPSDPSQWSLDVMFVPKETFSQMWAEAKPTKLEGTQLVTPSLEHLLALKLHALKHGKGLRVLKDLTDVAQLLLANSIDPSTAWVRNLFDKHSDSETYEKIIRLLS